jgi:hypothetical protein
MPLKPCKECGRPIALSADFCPGCGVAKPAQSDVFTKRRGCLPWALGFLALVWIFNLIGDTAESVATRTSDADMVASAEARQATTDSIRAVFATRGDAIVNEARRQLASGDYTAANRTVGPFVAVGDSALLAVRDSADAGLRRQEATRALERKWTYRAETDPMTGRVGRTAFIMSENTVNFDFPYEGPQRGRLTIRDHPTYGRDVFLTIEEGQFLCDFRGCRVRIRFDEGAAQSWTAAEPSDQSTTVLFIQDHDRFVQQLRRSTTVRVQPEVYQEGAPVFEFHVGGFSAERHAGTTP